MKIYHSFSTLMNIFIEIPVDRRVLFPLFMLILNLLAFKYLILFHI